MKQRLTPPKKKSRSSDLQMIVEMIEAGMALAREKGPHPMTSGCNCIVCINKRKQIIAGPPKPWRFSL